MEAVVVCGVRVCVVRGKLAASGIERRVVVVLLLLQFMLMLLLLLL